MAAVRLSRTLDTPSRLAAPEHHSWGRWTSGETEMCMCTHIQWEGRRRRERISYEKGVVYCLHLCWWSGVSPRQGGKAGSTLGAVLVMRASGEGSLAVGASGWRVMERRKKEAMNIKGGCPQDNVRSRDQGTWFTTGIKLINREQGHKKLLVKVLSNHPETRICFTSTSTLLVGC